MISLTIINIKIHNKSNIWESLSKKADTVCAQPVQRHFKTQLKQRHYYSMPFLK